MRLVRAVAPAVLVTVVLAGCAKRPVAPAPSPTEVPLRAVAACAATVVVPAETTTAEPSASEPPTVVLLVGDSVTFDVPAGARVGLSGAASPGDDASVCAAPAAATGTAVYVATAAGYLRVSTQIGIEAPAQLFLKVTP